MRKIILQIGLLSIFYAVGTWIQQAFQLVIPGSLIGMFLLFGLSFMAHGAQKLFGWFGGYGLKGTGDWFESIGMKPGVTTALLAGLAELAGGTLFTLGLFTPLAGILIAATMVIAIAKVHGPNGYWATQN